MFLDPKTGIDFNSPSIIFFRETFFDVHKSVIFVQEKYLTNIGFCDVYFYSKYYFRITFCSELLRKKGY
jgi:hypothetical protein